MVKERGNGKRGGAAKYETRKDHRRGERRMRRFQTETTLPCHPPSPFLILFLPPRGGEEWSRFWSKAIWPNWLELEMPPLEAKLVPRTKSSRLADSNIWQYLQFSPVAGIFANIEYWPLLNADELAPDIEYWLYIERGNIRVRHSINQFGKTANFDVIQLQR